MRPRRQLRLWRLLPGLVLLLLTFGLIHGSTAANYVSPSRAGISSIPTTAREMAPYACSGMYLEVIVWSGGGTLVGTPASELLLGSPRRERIEGDKGDDCLVGGDGRNDGLDGGPGYDICIGNATTRFDNCEVQIVQ